MTLAFIRQRGYDQQRSDETVNFERRRLECPKHSLSVFSINDWFSCVSRTRRAIICLTPNLSIVVVCRVLRYHQVGDLLARHFIHCLSGDMRSRRLWLR